MRGLEIDAEAMKRNMRSLGGDLISEAAFAALIPYIGWLESHRIVANACRKAQVANIVLENVLDEEVLAVGLDVEIDLDPSKQLGEAQKMIDRALAASEKTLSSV